MKKALILSLMLALVCSFAVAKPIWRIGGGLDMPMEDGFSMGFHGIGGVEMPDTLANNLGLLICASYHSIPWDTEGADIDIDPMSIIGATVEVKYGIGQSSTKPYLLGGLGFASWKQTMPSYTYMGYTVGGGDVDGTDLIISLGGGMTFGTVFLEARYQIIDEFDNLPISVGVSF